MNHEKILGYVYVTYGVVSVLASMLVTFVLYTNGVGFFPAETVAIVRDWVSSTGALAALWIGSFLAVATGMGLLWNLRVARTAALILAVLGLIDIPIGTAIGLYTLWVLLRRPQPMAGS